MFDVDVQFGRVVMLYVTPMNAPECVLPKLTFTLEVQLFKFVTPNITDTMKAPKLPPDWLNPFV